jgi:Zn ribbon nucleic-acid-binding protein
MNGIERQLSRSRTQFLKHVGRKCEACGATSEIPKWALTDKGLECPACGHTQGGA